MAFQDRKQLIAEIEKKRDASLIAYVTGDRPIGGPGLTVSLAMEPTAVHQIHAVLKSLGKRKAIDLFLYTRGGQVDFVWPVVSLLREYATERFSVLIPFRAHSAGTLLALGADEIVMGEAAELTSVDPTTGNPFNPVDELEKTKRKGISVEDVAAYFEFARDKKKVGLTDPNHILAVFGQLTNQLHPLALGHVQRIHAQIRFLADKLVRSRRKPPSKTEVGAIVEMFTEKLYSHTHAVNRQDAKELLGDVVVFSEGETNDSLWNLYSDYAASLHLNEPQNCWADLNGKQQEELTYTRGIVESSQQSAVYESVVRLTVVSQQPDKALYSKKMQEELGQMTSAVQGLPLFIPGLPGAFTSDVLFEGWRENSRGI